MARKIYLIASALIFCAFGSGCATSIHIHKNTLKEPTSIKAQPVFVKNPEMEREFKILSESGIYQISNTPDNVPKLTLLPIRQGPRCGNPLMLTIFTFGLIPSCMPGAYTFEYELETETGKERFIHHLPIYERFSIWERLLFQNKKSIFSTALKHSSKEKAAAQIIPQK